jgi:hypothetical protein
MCALASLFGEDLLERVPKVWECMEAGLASGGLAGTEAGLNAADALALTKALVDSMQVVRDPNHYFYSAQR